MNNPSIPTDFVNVDDYAEANGMGINEVYQYLRRSEDPLPHIKRGRRKQIDVALARNWMRRHFGVNVEQDL